MEKLKLEHFFRNVVVKERKETKLELEECVGSKKLFVCLFLLCETYKC